MGFPEMGGVPPLVFQWLLAVHGWDFRARPIDVGFL